MNIKVWYLNTCSTCQRIIGELELNREGVELQNIKSHPVSEADLELFYKHTGSYKALINARSTQFRQMEKKAKDLSESEARELLLSHYAFLKRPVIQVNDRIFVGNAAKTISEIKQYL